MSGLNLTAPTGDTDSRCEVDGYQLQQLGRHLQRIRLVAESAGALIEQLRGCEINPDDVLELFAMVQERAEAAEATLVSCRPNALQGVAP